MDITKDNQNKKRSLRRHHERRIQKKRLKNYRKVLSDPDEYTINKRYKGHLKNNHHGCGCKMCKTWKHKHVTKVLEDNIKKRIRPRGKETLKHSDRKRLVI